MNISDNDSDAAEQARRDLIHTEQIKLSASFLNHLALTTIAMGLIVPSTFALDPPNEAQALGATIMALACFAAGILLHLLGQKGLGCLR